MNLQEYKTALITGASSGMGKAFAEKLAELGKDIIIIARNSAKLTDIKNYIENTYKVSVLLYSLDLSKPEDSSRYCEIIRNYKPDILINSAGFGRPGRFGELDFECHREMLEVHINAVVKSSYEALLYMQENKKGLIINVSSLAGLLDGKGYTMYGSTKRFIEDFSLRLAYETEKYNVYVQALCPGFTYSGFHDTEYYPHFDRNKYPKFVWQTSERVAEESLKNYRKSIFVPGRFNRFVYFLSETFIFRKLISKVMKSSKK